MARKWGAVDVPFVQRRYDRIAKFYTLYERIFCTPWKVREAAVERLALRSGDKALEVGCGRGKNLPLLYRKVGERGSVVGIDISKEMLAYAKELQERQHLHSISLFACDALEYAPGAGGFDAVLFCLSYNTMPHRKEVLAHAWSLLGPGGRLVILDGKPPQGLLGRVTLPLGEWLVYKTVLGNPHVQGWEDLGKLDPNMRVEEFLFGSYYVASAIKH